MPHQLSLGPFGHLDFGDWLYGLLAAAIGGGATAVVTAFSLPLADPSHFQLSYFSFRNLLIMFSFAAVVNMAMFLRTRPLPAIRQTLEKITETVEIPAGNGRIMSSTKTSETLTTTTASEVPKP